MDTKTDDGYGLNTVDLSGPEYGSGTNVGPAVNNQNLSQVSSVRTLFSTIGYSS